MIVVNSTLWLWNGAGASWHFISIPPDVSTQIRAHSLLNRGGFGSVKVEATIAGISWRMSVFPQKTRGYLLPVKADVRHRAGISAGDDLTVELELL